MAQTTHTIMGTERAWAGRVKVAFVLCTLAASVLTALAWPLSPIGWVLALISVALLAIGILLALAMAIALLRRHPLRYTRLLLAGCMAGALAEGVGAVELSIPTGCAAILAGNLAWSAAAPAIGRLRAARPPPKALCVLLDGRPHAADAALAHRKAD